MVQFEFNDDGIFIAVSAGAGDLKAKIEYTKIPSVKNIPADERRQLEAILQVVISHLELELAKQANHEGMTKLKALQPLIEAPPEKQLILPGV